MKEGHARRHYEGELDLRKKVMPVVIMRQRDPWRGKDGVYMYFEDNAGVIARKGAGRRSQVLKVILDDGRNREFEV